MGVVMTNNRQSPRLWILGACLISALLLTLILVAFNPSWMGKPYNVLAQVAKTYIYSAKYTCEKHLTTINIRNINNMNVSLSLKRVTPQTDTIPGTVSNVVARSLDIDHALNIDCRVIQGPSLFGSSAPEEGFLVIESPVELEVVAVYSSEPTSPAGSWSGAWNKVAYVLFETLPEGFNTVELWDKIIFTLKESITPSNSDSPAGDGSGGTQPVTPPPGEATPFPGGSPQVDKIYELVVRSSAGFADIKDVVRKAFEEAGKPLPPELDIKIISVEFGVGAAGAAGKSDPCSFLGPVPYYEVIIPAPLKETPVNLKGVIAGLARVPPEYVVICDVEFAIGEPSVDVEYVQPKVVER